MKTFNGLHLLVFAVGLWLGLLLRPSLDAQTPEALHLLAWRIDHGRLRFRSDDQPVRMDPLEVERLRTLAFWLASEDLRVVNPEWAHEKSRR